MAGMIQSHVQTNYPVRTRIDRRPQKDIRVKPQSSEPVRQKQQPNTEHTQSYSNEDLGDFNTHARGQETDIREIRDSTTSFVSTNIKVENGVIEPTDLDGDYLRTGDTGYQQGIKEFLEKPIPIIANATIATTQAAGTVLATIPLDQGIFSGNPIWANKVTGFLGIRGVFHLRLQINANPFQQGRLLFVYEPMKQHYAQNFSRLQSLVTATQLPNVQLDIANETEATLVIPYVTLQSHLNLFNNEGSWGVANLMVYLPYAAGTGTDQVYYTIWASLHDVELVAPTNPSVTAQSNEPSRAPIKTRSRKKTGTSASAGKESTSQGGTITNVLRNVGSVASYLTGIPIISSYAGATEWALDIAANITSAFGWSRPLYQDKTTRMNRTYNHGQQNYDVVDNAFSIGMSSRNQVRALPGFGGTDIDEMSFAYLKGISTYYFTASLAATNVPGDVIYNISLAPSFFTQTIGSTTQTTVMPPFSYIAQCHSHYRGGFIIKVKFGKTKFHSARLGVVFLPGITGARTAGAPASIAPFSAANANYLHRDIIDIQEATEFEFYCPYVSLQPYLPYGQAYGSFLIYVINGLKNPSTCASTILFATEVRAAKDFEVFGPQEPRYLPSQAVAQSNEPQRTQLKENCFEERGDNALTVAKPIGGSKTDDPMHTLFAESTVGEQFHSVKQIALRASIIQRSANASQNFSSIKPFTLGALPRGTTTNYNPTDWYSMMAHMFAFSRGGVIYRYIYNPTGTVSHAYYQVGYDFSNAKTNSISITPFQTTIFEKVIDNIASIFIPMYHNTHGRLNAPDGGTVLGANFPYRSAVTLLKNDVANSATAPQITLRQGADDTQFAFFLGVPPLQANDNAGIY